jgi:hypothetical protein
MQNDACKRSSLNLLIINPALQDFDKLRGLVLVDDYSVVELTQHQIMLI